MWQLDYMAHQIAVGSGKENYLELMKQIVEIIVGASFCPFGQSIAMPLYSLLNGFEQEVLSFTKQEEYFKEAGA